MSQPSPPPPQTSQKYTPKFELWVNVFLHQAFWNVVNSLTMMETVTKAAVGVMFTEVKIPSNRLLGTVMLLESWVLDQWRENDQKFAKAKQNFELKMDELLRSEGEPHALLTMHAANEYFHEIIEVFKRQDLLKVKPPRSLDEG